MPRSVIGSETGNDLGCFANMKTVDRWLITGILLAVWFVFNVFTTEWEGLQKIAAFLVLIALCFIWMDLPPQESPRGD